MGMTLSEKLLALHAGKSSVKAGEYVQARVDKVMMHDVFAPFVINEFRRMAGGRGVWNPNGVVAVIDHEVPAASKEAAQSFQEMRNFCVEQGISAFHYGEGVCHQIFPELGYAKPGALILGTDSHTCTYGALGCFAMGVGSTEMALLLLTGETWFKVPSTVYFHLVNRLEVGVSTKDLILYLIGKRGPGGLNYKTAQFGGPGVEHLTMDQRLTLCNMTVDMGAKNGIFEPDWTTSEYLSHHCQEPYQIIQSDPDAEYEESVTIDLASLEPVVAGPGNIDIVQPVSALAGKKIHQGFIGSCTNGRYEDLEIAAEVLSGKKVMSGVRLIVTPASKQVYQRALHDGLIETIVEAGGIVTNPYCGLCYGKTGGRLAEEEVCISSNNRNFPGRLGPKSAEVFLASV